MQIRRTLLYSLSFLFLPALCQAAEPFRYPEGKHGKHGELRYRHDLPVLVVEGTPEQMGDAVGVLALKPSSKPLDYPRDLLKAMGADKLWSFVVQSGKGMFKQFPEPYRKELESIAGGASVDEEGLIVGNTLFDLKKIFACSALLVTADRSSTGGPLLGRNLDYPSLGYIHQHSLVTVYRPEGKHAFVSVGFPGLVGCLSGMNDAGLALGVLEVAEVKEGEPRFNAKGIPYALCFRKLLEECTTIAEARALLEKQPRTAIMNLVVADRQGVGVFEISPKRVVQRDSLHGTCTCTNHFCHADMKVPEPTNIAWTLDRFKKLQGVQKEEDKLGPEDLHRQLDAVNLGTLTLQTMVFETRTLRLHLAVGEIPASKGPFRTLELGPLFRGEKRK